MDWRYLFLAAAILSQLSSSIIYVRKMIRGKTRPNLVSWVMWATWPLIGFLAAISKGVTWAAIPILMSTINSMIVAIAGIVLRRARWKLTAFDYFCGALSIIAIVLWLATDEPNIALAISIFGDFLVAMPTIKKARTHPDSEAPHTYVTGIYSALTSFLFVVNWRFEEIAFPIYLIITNLMILFFVIIQPKLVQNKK